MILLHATLLRVTWLDVDVNQNGYSYPSISWNQRPGQIDGEMYEATIRACERVHIDHKLLMHAGCELIDWGVWDSRSGNLQEKWICIRAGFLSIRASFFFSLERWDRALLLIEMVIFRACSSLGLEIWMR